MYLQGLEPEIVIVVISIVDNGAVQAVLVLADDLVREVGQQRRLLTGLGLNVAVQHGCSFEEGLLGVLVQIGHHDARCKQTIVRMLGGQRCSGLGSQLVQFGRGDTPIYTQANLSIP